MRIRFVALVPLVASLAVACDDPASRDPFHGYTTFDGSACQAGFEPHAPDPGVHVSFGSDIHASTNPPSSGEHYPIWSHWGVASMVIPRGVYVHNEEHGGVVVLYRCDDQCAATRAALTAFVRALPAEPACAAEPGISRRVLLTEDPQIPTRIAAASWGFTYLATCFDAPSLRDFVLEHTGHGPEDFCSDGAYP